MKNRKVIIINGLGRGGTNIVWNILQSHPQVCSPMYETGEVFTYQPRIWNAVVRRVLRHPLARKPPVVNLVGRAVDSRLYQFKLKNLESEDNRFKFEGVPYTREEVESSVLCVKSIGWDWDLSDLIREIYPECFVVGLVRNGFAFCEGHIRRGRSTATRAGKFYREYLERMIADSRNNERYLIVKFEDVLQDPFGKASEMYRFAQLEPTQLEKLRLRSKPVLSADGQHKAVYGEAGQKYWFDVNTIREILVPDQSQVQKQALSPEDARAFEREARPVLEYFGYL